MTSEARSCNVMHSVWLSWDTHTWSTASCCAEASLSPYMQRPHVGVLMDTLAEVPADSQHQPPGSEDTSR